MTQKEIYEKGQFLKNNTVYILYHILGYRIYQEFKFMWFSGEAHIIKTLADAYENQIRYIT